MRAQFAPHPDVDVRVEEVRPGEAWPVRAYEEGVVLLCDGIDLGLDPDRVQAWENRGTEPHHKKAKHDHLTRKVPVTRDGLAGHAMGGFTDDPAEATRIAEDMIHAVDRLQKIVHRAFPDYAWTDSTHSWRFRLTTAEALHYDYYAEHRRDNAVRVFLNLDSEPRVWGVGRRLTDTVARCPEAAAPAASVHQFNERLTKMMERGEAPSERAYLVYPAGTAVVVQSQLVAHQILFGRRLLVGTFNARPSSMVNPDMLPQRVVDRIVENSRKRARK